MFKYSNKPISLHLKIILIFALFFSCQEKKELRHIERSFYYWKSVFKLTDFDQEQLHKVQVKTLYVKFFDVVWNKNLKKALPVAVLRANENFISLQNNFRVQIIPVIFITNECLQKIDSSQIQILAENIYTLTTQLTNKYAFNNIPEVQFDCDWTASTRANYFLLLEKSKALWKNAVLPISATIRLHQVKYILKTGVPPVDKGLLMCYNMGNLKNPAVKNSIIEKKELQKYTVHLSSYPLPLDIALPLFDWKVLFRNNAYTGLIQDLPDAVFSESFIKRNHNRYEVTTDTLLHGYSLKKGDVLRNEQSDYNEIMEAAKLISKQLKNTQPRVALYHFDSLILSKYTNHELESIYNSLR